ncbi:hypothetical protein BDY24DRAFT_403062 [Mrakia frigida]|uniref:uncharacterized protein n=1 Tax=Mrakia frigida TaxID=29902 RepID=UPI003FCBF14E
MSKDDDSSMPTRGSLYDFNRGAKYIDTQRSTLEALDDPRANNKPGYAQAIIDGYARSKLQKGKSLEDIDKKLHELGKVLISNKLGPFVEEIQSTRDDLNKVPGYEDAIGASGSSKASSATASAAPPYWNRGGEKELGKEKGL